MRDLATSGIDYRAIIREATGVNLDQNLDRRKLSDYEQAINALIPKAVRKANKKMKLEKINIETEAGALSWNKAYHKAMNELAYNAGLRNWK